MHLEGEAEMYGEGDGMERLWWVGVGGFIERAR